MITFWLCAGLLFAAALAFILVPQFRTARTRSGPDRTRLNVALYQERLRELERRRDAEGLDAAQFEAARAEAARGLLDDVQRPGSAAGAPLGRAIPLVTSLAMPLLALVLYFHWGSLDKVISARQHRGERTPNIEEVTTRLEALLAAKPDSSEGWSLLARAYMAEQRMGDAARGFERAANLAGRPAELLGQSAEALYYAGDRKWTPQLQALVDEALASNPEEVRSLGLAGKAAFRERRYAQAITYWERLMAALPEQDPSRDPLAHDIAQARELAQTAAGNAARP